MARELNSAERATAIAWLERKWDNDKRCPVCGSSKWAVGPHMVSMAAVDNGNNISLGGLSYPLVMVVSDQCGYTFLMNAVVMGVAKGDRGDRDD